MQVYRIQNNNSYNTQFGAKIIPTPYLQEGLYKIMDAPVNIYQQNELLNALKYIAKDTSIDTFRIDKNKDNPNMSIIEVTKNNKTYSYEYDKFYSNTLWNKKLAIVEFFKKYYGSEIAKKVLGNQDLLKDVREVEQQLKAAKDEAYKGLRDCFNQFIENTTT